jgi:hypothetical protein
MKRAEARLQRAKAIGRAAYRLVRDAPIGGYIEIESGRKLARDYRRGSLAIELYAAAGQQPCDGEFSQLRIRCAGRKVFVIRWSVAGAFKIVAFEPGDWQRDLQVPDSDPGIDRRRPARLTHRNFPRIRTGTQSKFP